MTVRVCIAVVAVVLGVALSIAGATVVAAAEPAGARGPAFGGSLVEMTPDALARFGKALAAEEGARRQVADSAAAAEASQKQRRQQFDECQMRLITSPEYQKVMQEMSQVMQDAKPTASWQQALQVVTAKQETLQTKVCGPEPGRDASASGVAASLREIEGKVAKENGFTPRQYAILKERVSPLCLSDTTPPWPAVVRVPSADNNFYVYTAAEVTALRPHCPVFLKLLYPNAR